MVFGSTNLTVDVVAHHHANLDSFPFRYGIHYPKTTALNLYDCEDYEWEIHMGIEAWQLQMLLFSVSSHPVDY